MSMPKVVYQNTGERIGNPWIRYILGRIYVKNKNWLCSVVGPTGCLHKDTIVKGQNKTLDELYKSGNKFIDTVSIINPLVIKFSDNKKSFKKSISEIIDSGIKEVYEIKLETGKKVIATDEHKFFKEDDLKITEEIVSDLSVGDYIKTYYSGNYLNKSKIKSIKKIGKIQTYDLHTPKYHNFLLDNGILSHNSGKTYHAISFCEEMSKQSGVHFGIDNIVFSLNELMSLINSAKLQKGSCILFDEPQISISNREFQSKANKVFNYLLTTFRHRNFILLFCTPYDDLLDKTSRKLFHAKFQMMSIDKKHKTSTSKPLEIEYNSQKQKFYNKFLRVVFKPENKNKFTSQKLKKLTLPLANKQLIKQYEAKKMAFTKDLNLKIEMELDNDNRKKQLEGKRKPLTDIQDQTYRLLVKFDWSMDKVVETLGKGRTTVYETIQAIKRKGYPVKTARNKLKTPVPLPDSTH